MVTESRLADLERKQERLEKLLHRQQGDHFANADRLQGRRVQNLRPADGQVLAWSESRERFEPASVSEEGVAFTGTTPLAHSLSGALHTGALSSGQYPEAVLTDGTRPLTADWDAGPFTINGVLLRDGAISLLGTAFDSTIGVNLNITTSTVPEAFAGRIIYTGSTAAQTALRISMRSDSSETSQTTIGANITATAGSISGATWSALEGTQLRLAGGGGANAITITNAKTLRVRSPSWTSSLQTVTNMFGVVIEDQVDLGGTTINSTALHITANNSASTSTFAIFQTGTAGLNVLNANTRIGSTVAPTVPLDVTGAAIISATLGVGAAPPAGVEFHVAGQAVIRDGGSITPSGISFEVQKVGGDGQAQVGVVTAANFLSYFVTDLNGPAIIWDANATENDLRLGTTTNLAGAGFAEIMRLNSTGVGIGVTPTTSLHVSSAVAQLSLVSTNQFSGMFTQAGIDHAISWDTSSDMRFGTAANIAVGSFSEKIRFTAAGDVIVADGGGVVVGHTAQLTISNTSELQVLGTSGADSSMILARFSDNASPPSINFGKSRSGTLGTFTILQDADIIGQIKFNAAQSGQTMKAAIFMVEVDDATPAAGDTGVAYVWEQMAGGGGGAARETMRLSAAGNLGVATNAPIATVDINGGLAINLVAKTTTYTATTSDHVITCDASGGAFTVTLPAISGVQGIVYHIKKIDSSANAVTVDGNGSETIDGGTTATISTQFESIMIVAGASEWHII